MLGDVYRNCTRPKRTWGSCHVKHNLQFTITTPNPNSQFQHERQATSHAKVQLHDCITPINMFYKVDKYIHVYMYQ